MSRNFLIKKLRTQNWYALVTAALRDMGMTDWRIEAPRGCGHPKLIVNHNGRTLKLAVPSTERGRGDHRYLVRHIRRWAER